MRKVFKPEEVDLKMVDVYRDFIPEKVFDAHMHLYIPETAPAICETKRAATVEDYLEDMGAFLPGAKEIRLNMLPWVARSRCNRRVRIRCDTDSIKRV